MRYFGPVDAPITDGIELAPTPVGEPCAYGCGVEIKEGDVGFLIPFLDGSNPPPEQPWHQDCLMQSVLGPGAALVRPRGTPRSPNGSPSTDRT